MGNPHAVLVVDDAQRAPVQVLGPLLESHERFPARANVSFMQILSRSEIQLRVYERGVGETQACGSGACAAVVHGIHAGSVKFGGIRSPSWRRTLGRLERRSRTSLAGGTHKHGF